MQKSKILGYSATLIGVALLLIALCSYLYSAPLSYIVGAPVPLDVLLSVVVWGIGLILIADIVLALMPSLEMRRKRKRKKSSLMKTKGTEPLTQEVQNKTVNEQPKSQTVPKAQVQPVRPVQLVQPNIPNVRERPNMNSWTAVGYIFVGLGVIFLGVGIFVGMSASSIVGQFIPQLAGTLFMAAFLPYGVIASCMFVVGAVGLYAGRTPLTTQSYTPTYQQSSQNPVSLQASPPLPKQAVCPSCGQFMIFIEQYQRWYCPQERKYV